MVGAPNVLCIDSGLESPYAPGARLFRNPRPPAHASQEGSAEAGRGGGGAVRAEGGVGGRGGAQVPKEEGRAGGGGGVEGGRGALNAQDEWLPLYMRLQFDSAADRFLVRRLESADEAAEEGGETCIDYELVAVVSCVFGGSERDWKEGDAEDGRHLISHVRVRPEDDNSGPTAQWLLVNDFLIRPVSEDEVVRFQEWRTPAVIYYARKDLHVTCPPVPYSNPITRNVYKNDRSLATNPVPGSRMTDMSLIRPNTSLTRS